MQFLSPRRLQATQITGQLVGIEEVPHRSLKPWKLSGKLRIPLCRIGKVYELLAEQIVEGALDAESPFDTASRPALLYPDLVELDAAHAATISIGPSRTQKDALTPFLPPVPHLPLTFDQFRSDVQNGTLPQVSWIVAPAGYTGHSDWPVNYGAWYISQVLDILVSNPG